MKKLFFSILFVTLATGCGKKLRPDPVVPAIEANYPTAEIHACGKIWHGLGICKAIWGQSYAAIKTQIQVYHDGTLTVDSKDCEINTRISYHGTQLIPIHIAGKVDRNCLITVTVSPRYPNEGSQDIRIYSFRGHLAIRLIESEDDNWVGRIRKVSGNFSSKIKIWVGEQTSVQVVADGCGRDKSYQKNYGVLKGYVEFNLKEIIPNDMIPKTCVVEGFIRSTEFTDVLFDIVLSKYSSEFIPLPIPLVTIDGSKLRVRADKAVSIISLNGKYKIDYKTKFKNFKKDQPNKLEILTVSGRSVIGIWNIKKQKWKWLQ